MKKLLFLSFTCLVALFLTTQLQAQKASFQEVMSVELRNMGTILQGTEVKAYYLFYKEDKLDRKTNQYRLRIIDSNLKEVTNEMITGPTTLHLLEGTFNGDHLFLKFVDFKENKFDFRIYDTNGKFVKKIDAMASKVDIQFAYMAVDRGEIMEASVFSVPNKGFVNIKMTKEGHYGFDVQFFGKDRGFLGWNYKSDPTSKLLEFADFIACDEKTLLIQVLKKKGLMSNNMDAYLLGIDIATGKKKFETKLVDATHSMFMLNGLTDPATGNFLLFGQFSELGDNTMKDNSLGFCGMEIDPAGKIVRNSLVLWDKDVSKFLPVNYKGKIKDVGYVYFHKIVKSADGKIYAIGEQYKKSVSAGGVAIQALGGGASAYKVVVQDMMVFQFSSDFKLEGVSVFEKTKSNVMLPQGAGINGPQLLAAYVKAYGGFDYSYTQIPNDNSNFTVCLTDWEKEKGERGKMTFKSISKSGDEFVTDKIDLETDASALRVMPAKPGYVLITEYFRKLKTIESRLEKLAQ